MIGPKTWDRSVGIFGAVLDCPRTVWAACCVIYAINCALVCTRPGMALDFEFTKWNQGLMSGLPMDSPLLGFRTVKISPSLCEMDQKCPCIVCMKLCEVNGLSGVEIIG